MVSRFKISSVLAGLAAAGALAAIGGAAEAATVLNGTGNLTEMVHDGGAQSGNTVYGISNPTGYYVDFTSADTLTMAGSGYAQVNGPFDWVTITPQAPASANQGLVGFTDLQFSVPDHNNLPGGGQVSYVNDTFQIIANFLGGGSQTFAETLYSNNKYDVVADAGQVISSLEIGALTDANNGSLQFGDVRLVSFDAATGVPEPASWALMIGGMGLVGAVMRRRRGALQLA